MEYGGGANTNMDEEVEIDLQDLFWELLMKWKPILVCMVLCGGLLTPAMYLKDMRSYRASLAVSEEFMRQISGETDTESGEMGDGALDETEQTAVDNAVQTYRQLLDLEYLYDTTVRYHLDPRNLQALTLTYRLHADDAGQLSILWSMYIDRFGDSDVKKQLADAYGVDDPQEAAQMVSIGGGDTMSTLAGSTDVAVTVRAYLTEGIDADAIAECIQSVVSGYQPKVSRMIGGHTMSLLSEDEGAYSDTAIFTERIDIETRIVNLKNTVSSATTSFSDEQKQVYEYLTGELDEEYGLQDEGQAGEDALGDLSAEAELAEPSMDPKYFGLGMLIGAFLYAGAYVVWWVVSPRIRQSNELAGTLGVRAIGEIRAYPAKTAKERFFKSKWFYEARYKDRLNEEDAFATIHERLQLMPECDNGLLFIQPTELSDRQKEYVNRIVRESNRAITLISPEEANAVTIEGKLAEHPRVVLISSAGKTPYKEVRKLFAGCRTYGADLYGHILIEAVR